jgi:hypothetical protein
MALRLEEIYFTGEDNIPAIQGRLLIGGDGVNFGGYKAGIPIRGHNIAITVPVDEARLIDPKDPDALNQFVEEMDVGRYKIPEGIGYIATKIGNSIRFDQPDEGYVYEIPEVEAVRSFDDPSVPN